MKPNAPPVRGRPREFDPDKALDKALKVFWRKGFEGATLAELTRAMGINRPSLYAAFGNKEALFRKALERYARGPACHVLEAVNQPNSRAVAERFLHGSVDLLCNPKNPRGCLAVQAALACGDDADSVKKHLTAQRGKTFEALAARFERAQSEGDLPPAADARGLARYLCAVAQGLSVQSTSGASAEELRSVAVLALGVWPT